MKPNVVSPIEKKRLSVQAGLILLTSVTLGLAYNTLNPAGLRWSEPPQHEPAPQAKTSAGPYAVEMVLARPVSSLNSAVTPNQPAPAEPAPPPASGRTLVSASQTTWEKAQPLVQAGEVVLVDSRPRLTYEAGHIPNAVNLPENEITAKIVAFYSNYPPSSTRLVIYCSSANCGTSAKLASLLTQKYGYRDVQYVPGGYLDWLQSQKDTSQ